MNEQKMTVNVNLFPAIINDDYDGLTDEEADKVEKFIYQMNDEFTGHFSYDSDEQSEFAFCEVLRQYGDCKTLTFVEME